MRLGRRPTEEELAWRRVSEIWDASIGELKTKVDRALSAHATDEEKRDDDERR